MSVKGKIAIILFGVFLCLITLEIGLRLGGFILSALQEAKNMASIGQNGAYRIMCLGESTTFEQYPGILEETLNRRSNGIRFSVIDKGVVGIDTSGIISGLERNIQEYRPDMVIAMMGVNDARQDVQKRGINNPIAKYFFTSSRVYKLGKLLMLRLFAKFKENKMHAQYDILRNKIVLDDSQNAIASKDVKFYTKLGQYYFVNGEFSMAEWIFRKVIAANPLDCNAVRILALSCDMQRKGDEGTRVFKERAENILKAIEKNSEEERPGLIYDYCLIGNDFINRQELNYAEAIFKRILLISPNFHEAYVGLAYLSFISGRYNEVDLFLNNAIEINNDNDAAYALRALLSYELKEYSIAEGYMKKTSILYSDPYAVTAKQNYGNLKTLLDSKGIKLVCVQYPIRSIKPLKEIFESGGDIIFVDNETSFKKAVLKSGYKEYFVDIFGGDFGHCTDKGNKLLAENIADAILVRMPKNNAIRDAEAGYGQEK